MEKPLEEKVLHRVVGRSAKKKEIRYPQVKMQILKQLTLSTRLLAPATIVWVDRREFQTGWLSLPYKKKEGDVQAATLKKRQPYSSRSYSNYSYMPIGQMNGPWQYSRFDTEAFPSQPYYPQDAYSFRSKTSSLYIARACSSLSVVNISLFLIFSSSNEIIYVLLIGGWVRPERFIHCSTNFTKSAGATMHPPFVE